MSSYVAASFDCSSAHLYHPIMSGCRCPDGGAQPIHRHAGAAFVRRFTAVLVLLCATTAPAKDEWIQIETDRFVVTTNAKEKDARRLVRELETVSVVFKVAFRGLPEDTPPIHVLAAKNEDTLELLLPQFAADEDHFFPAGIFFRTPDRNWIVLDVDARGENRYATVYHEYFHSLALPTAPLAPLWFHEGLASMWENTTVNKNDVDTARPSQTSLDILNNVALMDLRTLLLVDQASPEYRKAHRSTIFYAQSWALAHYIFLGDENNSLSRGLGPYLDAIDQGVEPLEAFERGFGNIDDVEQGLRLYIRRRRFNILRVQKPPDIPDSALPIVALSEAEYHSRLGCYFSHTQQYDDALEHIDRALELTQAKDAAAHESLGIVHFRKGEYDVAAASFEKAVALSETRYLTQFYLGMLVASDNATEPAIAHFERAVVSNPFHGPSLARLAIFYALTGRANDQSLGMARRAAALLPDDPVAFTALGLTARLDGKRDEAIAAFEHALRLSPDMKLASSELAEMRAETPEP